MARGIFTRKTHGAVCSRRAWGCRSVYGTRKPFRSTKSVGFMGGFLSIWQWCHEHVTRPFALRRAHLTPVARAHLSLSRHAWSLPATRSWALLEKPAKNARIGTLKAERVCKGNAEPEISSRCFCNSRIVIVVHEGK